MRKILAFLLALIAVFPMLLASIITTSVVSFAFDRSFYLNTLDDPAVFDAIVTDGLLTQAIVQPLGLPADVDISGINEVIAVEFSRDYISLQVRDLVNGFFDYIQGRSDKFTFTVDMTPVKDLFRDDKRKDLIAAIVAVLPDCDPGQTPGLGIEGQDACVPAGAPADQVISQLSATLPGVAESIPDQITLARDWEQVVGNRYPIGWLPGMALPAAVFLAVIMLVFMAIFLWVICALIADGAWRGRLLWLGWVLVIPAGIVLLLGLILTSGIPNYWLRYGLAQMSFPISFSLFWSADLLRALILSALPKAAAAFLVAGGICAAAGITLIFWGLASARPKPKPVKQVDPGVEM